MPLCWSQRNGKCAGAGVLLSDTKAYLQSLSCLDRDPAQSGTDTPNIGINREVLPVQREQHDACNALAPQSCSQEGLPNMSTVPGISWSMADLALSHLQEEPWLATDRNMAQLTPLSVGTPT